MWTPLKFNIILRSNEYSFNLTEIYNFEDQLKTGTKCITFSWSEAPDGSEPRPPAAAAGAGGATGRGAGVGWVGAAGANPALVPILVTVDAENIKKLNTVK